jgi:hypothetical protein
VSSIDEHEEERKVRKDREDFEGSSMGAPTVIRADAPLAES